jgi:hypothetical protein
MYIPPKSPESPYDTDRHTKIKIEPDLFYHACDQLGLLIIQDMPSMKAARNAHDDPPDAAEQAEFERQVELMVNEHKSYPSVSTWVIYNEGWGQIDRPDNFPEFRITDRIRELDPTRLVNAVSGWWDHGAGDFSVRCLTPSPFDLSITGSRTIIIMPNRSAAPLSTLGRPRHTPQTALASRGSLAGSDISPLMKSKSSRIRARSNAADVNAACGPSRRPKTQSSRRTKSTRTWHRMITAHAYCSVCSEIKSLGLRAVRLSGRKRQTWRARSTGLYHMTGGSIAPT